MPQIEEARSSEFRQQRRVHSRLLVLDMNWPKQEQETCTARHLPDGNILRVWTVVFATSRSIPARRDLWPVTAETRRSLCVCVCVCVNACWISSLALHIIMSDLCGDRNNLKSRFFLFQRILGKRYLRCLLIVFVIY